MNEIIRTNHFLGAKLRRGELSHTFAARDIYRRGRAHQSDREQVADGLQLLVDLALTVTAGFDGKGLPLAFQLVGRPFFEAGLLRIADAYQQVAEWHRRSPDMSAANG